MSALCQSFRSALIIIAVAACVCSSAAAVTLAEQSRTDYCIVVGSDAIPAERRAAAELQGYLKQVTGARFAIAGEVDVKPNDPQILVGPSRRAKRLLSDTDWEKLGRDGIIIRTYGKQLILAGGRPRGTLYAVYTFLEDTVGIRWWTSTESTIPHKKTLRIPELNTNYTPKLLCREAYYQDTNANPLFTARMKLNGHFSAIPEEYGGHYSILGWCHTSYALLPPSQYFAAHPDWYAEQNGKRSADWGQLCFSNEEMLGELTRQALGWIRKNPNAGIISISQNDWIGNCQCAKCKAIDTEEGSASGSLIRGINQIAEEIEKQYPDMLIETLAYQYTRKPPLYVKPRTNVVVRLCSIECNFGRPLDSDYNAGFRDDLKKWAAIAPNLYIWNYVTDFAAYIQPHPNMRALAPDIRFFVDNHTIGIFEQGDPGCTIGDFDKMRVWLLAHVMWDPSKDEKALMAEFMKGYYGAAAPYLQQYQDLVHDACEKKNMHLGCYNDDLSFLTLEVMNEAWGLFAKAQEAVEKDPILSARVRRERLVLDHAMLKGYNGYKAASASSGKPFAGPDDPAKLAKEFVDLARQYKNQNLTEGQPFESYVPGLEALFVVPPTPEELSALPKDDCIVIQESAMQLIGKENGWVDAVKDPAASDGSAARMPGSHTQWATQFNFNADNVKQFEGRWKCYAVIRCETGDAGSGFQIGIFDPAAGFISRLTPYSSKADEAKYKTYYLGSVAFRPGTYLWVAPFGDGNAMKGIYTDRFVLVRDK